MKFILMETNEKSGFLVSNRLKIRGSSQNQIIKVTGGLVLFFKNLIGSGGNSRLEEPTY